jgi:hypothetical protein
VSWSIDTRSTDGRRHSQAETGVHRDISWFPEKKTPICLGMAAHLHDTTSNVFHPLIDACGCM